MFVNSDKRYFEFSNGLAATACSMLMSDDSHRAFCTIGDRNFDLPSGTTMVARQGIIDYIKKVAGLSKNGVKVKVTYEHYICLISIPEKNIRLGICAIPCSEQYTNIEVFINHNKFCEGKEKIAFKNIRGIQNLALRKLSEYEKRCGYVCS